MGKMMRLVLSHSGKGQTVQESRRVPEFFTNHIKEAKRTGLKKLISSNILDCRICEVPFDASSGIGVGHCTHFFCSNCMVNYASYKINVGEEVLCAQEGCQAKMTSQSKLFKLLGKKLQSKFKSHQLWRQTISNPNIRVCPSQNCQDGIINLTSHKVQCSHCRREFCRQCMMEAHPNRSCDQQFTASFKDWKKCPKCGIFIEKIDGCNHMFCRCNHQFCFSCGSDWSDHHYECKDEESTFLEGEDDTEDGIFCSQCTTIELPCFLLTLFLLFLPLFLLVLIMIIAGGGVILVLFAFLVMPVLMIGSFPSFSCTVRLLIIVFFPFACLFFGFFTVFTHFRPRILTPVSRALKKYFNTISHLLQLLS